MEPKSKTRQKLEDEATKLGVSFDDDTTGAKLKDDIAAAKAAKAAETAAGSQGEGQGDDQGDDGAGGAKITTNDAPPAPAATHAAINPATTKPATPKGAVLRVVGPGRGRWRAGQRFNKEPVDLPLADLRDADIAAIEADPLLSCVRLDASD